MAIHGQNIDNLHFYSDKEEKINVISHALGIGLSLLGAIVLLIKATKFPWLGGLSLMIFALSQFLIFSASTFYHAQKKPLRRYYANIVDHAMIYISIAGTYSPFCLITLKNHGGIMLFAFVWLCALTGILLKTRFTGQYNLLSTIMYIALGWVIIFYWPELRENLPSAGIYWLIAGGLAYTIGAVLYMIDKIPYNHALFHLFILIGSFCHFVSIYFYIHHIPLADIGIQ